MSLLLLVIWLSLPAYALFFISREQASRGKYYHSSSTNAETKPLQVRYDDQEIGTN